MAAAPSYPTFIEGLRMLVLESIITSVTVNYFGGEPPDPQACSREPINKLECVAVDGMRGIFWRQVFTPSAVASRGASHVWLFDSDLAVWPAFDLRQLVYQMQSLGAALAQPAVLPPKAGGHSSSVECVVASRLPESLSCVASTVPIVEVMTPVFASAAWSSVHAMLEAWPERTLQKTDHLLNDVWCRYLHLRGGWAVPCIVSRTVRILHGDTKMVEFQAAYLYRSEIAYQRRHKPSLTDAEYSRLVKPYYVTYMHRIKMRPTCFSQQEVVCGALHGVEIRGRARR